ncbi:MAG: SWIM zinc finger domain-containing protein, partial [Deltaproteobacteria bacterium]|nr:SWIM zinc finger domain-containing protein [Deltaproteobacteria bacterium]
ALPHSSLTPTEQMLWAIDAELQDEYDLCQGTAEFWAQASYEASDWSAVADQLDARLRKLSQGKGGAEFLSPYRRDRLSNRLIRALEDAGRQDEIIPLCEREARETGSYMRLIAHLKHAKRWAEVEEWIRKGIAATHQQSPGIAAQLRNTLRERREEQQQWPQVAAFYAEDFFDRPGAATLRDLLKAAKHAGVEADVRAGAFHYLETGVRPQTLKPAKKTGALPAWPLPACEVPEIGEGRTAMAAPMRQALIDIAIDEKQPDEVLRWYDQPAPNKTSAWGYGWQDDDRIATAVVSAHPDRAIAMWKKMVDAQIQQVQVRAYETAATYLRKIHSAYKKHDREQEWKDYLAALRQANLRRPRLVQILDGLTGKRIVEM